jgi:hypothetical protein
MIGKMQSLEELETFGVHSYEQGKSLQEFSQLTKLWRLQVLLGTFELWEGTGHIEGLHSYIGTLISSCNLRHLHIHKWSSGVLAVKTYFPLSLESWCPTTSCSLQELHITYCYIDKVPNWMRLLRNLRELELYVISVRPEDVTILGRPVEEAVRAVRWNRAPKILGPPISATMCELRIDYRLN